MSRATRSPDMGPIAVTARLVWGGFLLATPGAALQVLGGSDESRPARGVMRMLGARHLLEAAVEVRFGDAVRTVGVGVDALHAVTALGFALFDRRWRRAALADATIASAFAVLGTTVHLQPA